jgi:hypothetical protein
MMWKLETLLAEAERELENFLCYSSESMLDSWAARSFYRKLRQNFALFLYHRTGTMK